MTLLYTRLIFSDLVFLLSLFGKSFLILKQGVSEGSEHDMGCTAGREGGTGSHHSLYSDKYSINSMNQKLSVLAIVSAYHPFTVYLMLHVCTESLFYIIPVLREINIYL